MDYTAWAAQHLQKKFTTDGKKRAAVYITSSSDKPLILLVHGISGDHNGLIPLAVELMNDFRVILIDLPGHGNSSQIRLPNAIALQEWFTRVLKNIESEFGEINYIVAHSFGCSAVLSSSVLKKKVLLINPVPTPSKMYAKYARAIMKSAHFWAHIYNWRLFILLRGMTLAKYRTSDSMRRVRWVGWNSKANYKQIIFQAKLVDIILDSSAYKNAGNSHVVKVICGMSDTTAAERDSLDMANVFGTTPLVFIRGGHLLPMESPVAVAGVITKTMVK